MGFVVIVLGLVLVAQTQARWGDVPTVDKLDVASYTGRWYEAYSTVIQRWTFQKNSFCTCAQYGINKDGTISVINSGRLKSPTGKENSLGGVATQPDLKFPGKLTVQFPGSPKGDYWVTKLGPLNAKNEYSYAIVTTPWKALMWVLVRDVDEFKQMYDKEVLQWLSVNGYSWYWNKPRTTYQGKDCLYPKSA